MPKSKTAEYRVFLNEKLKSGMYKMQAAKALHKKYPNLSMNTCVTHVYQWFPGKFNKNYDREAAAKERAKAFAKSVAEDSAKKPAEKSAKSSAVKPAKKGVKKLAPRTAKVNKEKTPDKKKKTQRKRVDGVEVVF